MLAQKVGMTRIFSDSGETIPVTMLNVNDCVVVSTKTADKDGYVSIRLGLGEIKNQRVSKPVKGFFDKQKVKYKRKTAEFRVKSEDALVEAGNVILPSHFVVGQKIDAQGVSIGKGF